MLNKNPIYLHNWVFWQHIIFINSYFLTHTQIVAAFMMMQNLNKRGFRAFSFTIPSSSELLQIFEIAAPVFITMTSKVCFFFVLIFHVLSSTLLYLIIWNHSGSILRVTYVFCNFYGSNNTCSPPGSYLLTFGMLTHDENTVLLCTFFCG